MRRLAQVAAKAAGWLSRRLGRGGGTTLPGVILLKLRPRAAAELARGLRDGAVAISATNGKTTTARLVDAAVRASGRTTVANTAGSNLLRGVTAAMLAGEAHATFGVFEVDEAALPAVVDQVRPRTIVLMNLFRDQLDRYGELETLAASWHAMVDALDEGTVVVLNADDPAVAYLGHDRPGTMYFGVDDSSVGRAGLAHAADSTHCPRCDTRLDFAFVAISHMGHWSCPSCGLHRPTPTVAAERVGLRALDGIDVEIRTPAGPVVASLALAGLHNAYNATAAVAAAHALGIAPGTIAGALAGTAAAFGRGERIRIGDHELVLLLAKNPAGANENVRSTLLADGELHVMVLLNDRTADGQDVSWIWDVDYEPLFDRVGSVTVSGDRAHDLALRFVYGGLAPHLLHVEPQVARALDHALAATPPGARVYALPTYTAMLDLRAELVHRGAAEPFWEDG